MSVVSLLLQAFVASRLVKRFGTAGVLFALPFVSLGAYGFAALGATIGVVRWAKIAENATDYSIMNTAKQLLWLLVAVVLVRENHRLSSVKAGSPEA